MQGSVRVLILDDSPLVARLAEMHLTVVGAVARVATSIEDYPRLFLEFQPHAVVTDLRMPDVDEMELCHRLRAPEGAEKLPIWLFSGISEVELQVWTETLGANGYIYKGDEPDVLRAHFRTLVEHVKAQGASKMSGFEELLAEFWTLTKQRLARIDELIDALETIPNPPKAQQNLELELHSLAGESALMGQTELSHDVRKMEAILSKTTDDTRWALLREAAQKCRTWVPKDT